MRKYKFVTPSGTIKGLFANMLDQTHLLVAGTTGSGKSVLCNGLITTGLYSLPFDRPGGIQFILIDPKGTELIQYRNLPHTIGYAVHQDEILDTLNRAVDIMMKRYKEMSKQGKKTYSGSKIIILIEELADLMTTNRRAYQPIIQRICQLGRAANMMLIVQTQTPIVKVIPTEIKVNFISTVALRTRNAQDSRNIIGVSGAELLPRYGECLYYTPELANVYQYSVPYITDDEQKRIINHWERQYKKRGLLRRIFGR